MPEESRKNSVQPDKEALRSFVTHCQVIIDGLGDSGAWQLVKDDFEKQRKQLDDNWQYVSDEKKMLEFRITKMAVAKILNLVSDYKKDMENAAKQLNAIENPKEVIAKDFDTE